MSVEKTVLCIGYHNPEGARHWVIRKGLEERGWGIIDDKTQSKGLWKKLMDIRSSLKTHRQDTTAVLITYPGQYLLPWIWLLTRRWNVPLILDAFISVYDTKVLDRGLVSAWSPRAWGLWLLDWVSCRLPNAILLDTPEHADFYVRTFGAKRENILVVPVCSRTDIFHPKTAIDAGTISPSSPAGHTAGSFSVVFHGTFIPLQGIDVILRAASLLQAKKEAVRFILIGKGQTFPAMEALAGELDLRNVEFLGMKTHPEIVQALQTCGCGLGVFAQSDKTQRIIPHKAFEIIACACPLITGDTPSARTTFVNGETALLVPCDDPQALAEAILRLKNDGAFRARIAENGHRLSLQRFQPHQGVAEIDEWLSSHTPR